MLLPHFEAPRSQTGAYGCAVLITEARMMSALAFGQVLEAWGLIRRRGTSFPRLLPLLRQLLHQPLTFTTLLLTSHTTIAELWKSGEDMSFVVPEDMSLTFAQFSQLNEAVRRR